MKYYPALHSLRGFAALWVVLFHSWFYSGMQPLFIADFLTMGWVGVHLFYLLSAFLLGYIYFQLHQTHKWQLSYFYKRRFLRIFPAYYFQLLILLLLSYFGIMYKFPSISNLLAHFFLFFNLPPSYTLQLNGVWWTLPIEFSFYLILPLLAFILKKVGVVKFLVLSFATTVAYRIAVYYAMNQNPSSGTIGQLPGVLFIFAIGLSSAYLVVNKINFVSRLQSKPITILSIIAFIIWSQIIINDKNYWTGSYLIFYWESVNAIILMLFILSIYQSKSSLITNHFFVWLGKISYGIYLWHLPVILLIKDKTDNFYALLAFNLPITLILAAFSYYFIEKRFSPQKF